jgi:hypothetical protein
MHLMAIFNNLKLPFVKNAHLLFLVEDFVREKHQGAGWDFRLREDGNPT